MVFNNISNKFREYLNLKCAVSGHLILKVLEQFFILTFCNNRVSIITDHLCTSFLGRYYLMTKLIEEDNYEDYDYDEDEEEVYH